MKKVICPNCGASWSSNIRSCPDCETSLVNARTVVVEVPKQKNKVTKCYHCGAPIRNISTTCPGCGKGLLKEKSNYIEESCSSSSNVFIYIFSFLIPLVGFVYGAISLTKESEYDKQIGKTCMLIGLTSTIIYAIFVSCSIIK